MDKVIPEVLIREHEGLHIVDFFFRRNGQLIKKFKVYLTDLHNHESKEIKQLENAYDYWDLHCSVFVQRGLRP